MITLDQLNEILPGAGAMARLYLDHINLTMEEFEINVVKRQAPFIGQVGHESGQLRHVEENLNYSASGLLNTFSKYFNAGNVANYARRPEAIANRVYANRMGNGDEASGDGWRHRGAGLIQLTGKDNQTACAEYFGIPIEQIGAWLRSPEGACRSAGYFWMLNGLNTLADVGNNVGITRRINGGTIGLDDRLALTKKAMEVLQ